MDQGREELDKVDQEERELVFESFGNEEAFSVGLALLKVARERKLPIAVDIERSGQRLFHFAANGSSVDNADWIERKKNLVKTTFRKFLCNSSATVERRENT